MKSWNQFIQYLQDAVMRIFSPSKDDYPPTGEQPFSGDPDRKSA